MDDTHTLTELYALLEEHGLDAFTVDNVRDLIEHVAYLAAEREALASALPILIRQLLTEPPAGGGLPSLATLAGIEVTDDLSNEDIFLGICHAFQDVLDDPAPVE